MGTVLLSVSVLSCVMIKFDCWLLELPQSPAPFRARAFFPSFDLELEAK